VDVLVDQLMHGDAGRVTHPIIPAITFRDHRLHIVIGEFDRRHNNAGALALAVDRFRLA
jgi:hypothetical protein